MGDTPTGAVTFLFTDMECSTAQAEDYPDQMRAARKRHDEILRGNIQAHNGYIFATGGDAFCAAFATAREALTATLVAQRALASRVVAHRHLQPQPIRQPLLHLLLEHPRA